MVGHTWLADDKMCTPCLVLLQWGNKDVWYFRVVSSEINHRLSHISQICSGFVYGRVPLKSIKRWQFHFLVLFRFSVLFICRKWVYMVKQNFKNSCFSRTDVFPWKKWQMARFSAVDQILQGIIFQSKVGTGEPGCQQWNAVLLNRLMVSSELCHTERPLPLPLNNKIVSGYQKR